MRLGFVITRLNVKADVQVTVGVRSHGPALYPHSRFSVHRNTATFDGAVTTFSDDISLQWGS